MKVFIAETITTTISNAFGDLLKQLNPDIEIPSETTLKNIIKSGNTKIFIASEDDDVKKIAGTLSLVFLRTPSGSKAQIEDVVVNQELRGKGTGKQLMQAAIEYTRQAGISKIDLTSSPHRVHANNLYQNLGFKLRTTNVYRLDL